MSSRRDNRGQEIAHRRRRVSSPRGQRVSRRRPSIWPLRIVLLGLVFLLGLSAVLYSTGPVAAQKYFYPIAYEQEIQESCSRHVISPYLVCAIIKAESDWDAQATSGVGAQGLMQLMPDTANHIAEMGLVDTATYPPDRIYEPAVNIEYGTAYLRYLVNKYHEIEPAVAAYNAGPGRVDQWLESGERDVRDVITYPETSEYLLKVVRAKENYERIYPQAFTPVG